MSVWLDKKYLNQLAPRLDNFQWKDDKTANHRCPVCGDSKKNKFKSRGYHFVRKGGLFYYCHNCQYSVPTYKLIEYLDPQLYKEYRFERWKNGENGYSNYQKPDISTLYETEQPTQTQSILDRMLDRLDQLPDDHPAVQYAKERQLPESFFNEMYYIDDVSKIQNFSAKRHKTIRNKHHRIIIPAFDQQGNLLGGTARAIDPTDHGLRYLTFVVKQDAHVVFGLDQVELDKTIYVVEGPLDRMFLPNSVAIGSANMKVVKRHNLPPENSILIFDNQPRNEEIVKLIHKAICNGYRVCLLPETFPGKDINDAILNGYSSDQIKQIIDNHTYIGLEARAMFNQWKKVDVV